ncbi:DUF4124 domain-containing protein [Kineococcus sp. SYSU DK001]|uniref:DUF4124 domain-containing protein n=1 Tax=Kineococcus sp. SYSU DK001 TaxID=3383122 RepID=UPI003D7EFE35
MLRRLSAVLLPAALALTLGTATPAIAADSASVTEAATTTSSVTMPAGGPFSTASEWRRDIRTAPLHPNSAAMVKNVATQTANLYGGTAAFNVTKYNTSFYTVPAGQKRVDVKWTDCQGKGWTPAGLLGPGGQFVQVPIPADAVPATGTDGQLTIFSPSTDQLWEFWKAKKVGSTWSACWGGRIDGVSTSRGGFSGTFGASASGLALSGGTIGIKDVQSGSIQHAVALHLPKPGKGYTYPATRGDGWDTSSAAVPEGTRLRLNPSVDVDALNLHPIAKMVAKAAQKYGFIVTDTSGCTSVVAESPAASIARTGTNPWTSMMAGTPQFSIMANFPWGKLQALPKDYGKR